MLDAELFRQVALGFLAFSLLASGSYILNDLVDLRSDRMHRSKANCVDLKTASSGSASVANRPASHPFRSPPSMAK